MAGGHAWQGVVRGRGGMYGRGCAWRGACMAGGVHGMGGMHDSGCMVGGACVLGGHVWQGDMHGRGCVHCRGVYMAERVCMAGGMCGRGACVAGGCAWQERLPLQRTVRILLGCALV